MLKKALLLSCTLFCLGQPLAAALSKSQLLELVGKGVDTTLIVQLVERDCVDFEVTAEVLLELSPSVPKEVLQAAMSCKGAGAAPEKQPATRAVAPAPALQLAQITVLAVVPATLDGDPDAALTAAILEELRRQRPRYTILDPLELTDDFEDLDSFHSEAPIGPLLAAARSRGGHALLLVNGSEFRRVEDPGIELELKIVEANQGRVVWSGEGRGLSNLFSWQAAKRNAARNAIANLP